LKHSDIRAIVGFFGNVTYDLEGYFGGFSDQEDNALLEIEIYKKSIRPSHSHCSLQRANNSTSSTENTPVIGRPVEN